MDLPIGPYETVMIAILSITIPIHRFLTRDEPEMRVPLSGLVDEIREKGYKWHIGMYILMYAFKAFIDQHNEAIKPQVGGFTHYVHQLEGDATLWVQDTFSNGLLTELLSFHYLFVYLFLIWFSPMYYILCRDEAMADKAVLNYFIIYVLAVPFYLFFNVEVTSSFIPGMDALLYHNDWNLFFFTEVDPLDNGIPSLHVGIPVGLLIINRLHVRDLGIGMGEWRHKEFDLFVAVNVPIYLFSIQYLGIHWITDLVPGLVLAIICALFTHRMQPKLRSLRDNGFRSLVPSKGACVTGLSFTIIGLLSIVAFIIDGPGTDSEKPTSRVGPGDVNLDVIEIHSLWEPVDIEVRNVGEEFVEVLVLHRDDVIGFADGGKINWAELNNGIAASGHKGSQSIGPGESWNTQVMTPGFWDGHYVLVNHPGDSGVGEVRITIDYVDDELMFSAIASSLPAFAIIGIVLGDAVWSQRK